MKIYELGYDYFGSRPYLDQLMQDPKVLLIDTRYSPRGKANWTGDVLRQAFGKRYRWSGATLGNKNYWAARKGAPISIVNLDAGVAALKYYLEKGYDLVLLCVCADYQACHRKVIVDALVKRLPEVEIVHYRSLQASREKQVAQPEQAALFDVPSQPL